MVAEVVAEGMAEVEGVPSAGAMERELMGRAGREDVL